MIQDANQRTETITGSLTGVSVSHRDATVSRIEAATPTDPEVTLEELREREAVIECFVLSTCNRMEWYVVTERVETGRTILEEFLPRNAAPVATWFDHDDAIEHLLRVGAGLDSMVLGEDEILGQLRTACQSADEIGALGPLLEETVWKAIHCGERVRTETAINEGVTSIGRAAVHCASEALDLRRSSGLVVGAGEMAALTGKALADEGVEELTIANRTVSRAETIANDVPVESRVVSLDRIDEAIARADVVISATASPEPVIAVEECATADETVVVDIAQPRDVSPEVDKVPGVERFDLDDLEAVTRATNAAREEEAARAEEIVGNAVAELQESFKRRQADAVIAAMYAGAETIKRRELAQARSRLSAGEAPSGEVLSDFADAMVSQLLAAPTKSLRDAAGEDDWETIQTAIRLFDPEFPDGRVSTGTETETVSEDADSTAQR